MSGSPSRVATSPRTWATGPRTQAAQALPASPPRKRQQDVVERGGPGWRSSTDQVVTGIGDTSGFHLLAAKEKDAFAWSMLATLGSAADGGVWTGYTCVTGSGHYAVAV